VGSGQQHVRTMTPASCKQHRAHRRTRCLSDPAPVPSPARSCGPRSHRERGPRASGRTCHRTLAATRAGPRHRARTSRPGSPARLRTCPGLQQRRRDDGTRSMTALETRLPRTSGHLIPKNRILESCTTTQGMSNSFSTACCTSAALASARTACIAAFMTRVNVPLQGLTMVMV
jgi:hypothetical protein